MAIRTRHNLAQSAPCIASSDLIRITRQSSVPTANTRSRAIPSTGTSSIGDDEQGPQINASAIQKFLLNAPPLPNLPVRTPSKNTVDRNEVAETRQGPFCWKPRVVAFAGQVSSTDSFDAETPNPTAGEIGDKESAGSQDLIGVPAKISSANSGSGPSLETAATASSGLNPVQEPD